MLKGHQEITIMIEAHDLSVDPVLTAVFEIGVLDIVIFELIVFELIVFDLIAFNTTKLANGHPAAHRFEQNPSHSNQAPRDARQGDLLDRA